MILGDFHLALQTSLTLRNYEDMLNIEQVYSIIALAAIANGSFNIASRAFMRLETIDTVSSNLCVYKSHKKLSLFNSILFFRKKITINCHWSYLASMLPKTLLRYSFNVTVV